MDAGMAALPPPARPRTNLEGSRSTRELQQMWRDSQALSANAHFHPINAPSQGRKERSMSWTSDLSANELGALLPPAALSSRRFTSSPSILPTSSSPSLEHHGASLGGLDISDPWGHAFHESSPYDTLLPPPLSPPGHTTRSLRSKPSASRLSIMTDVPTSRRPDSPASSTDLAYPERKALRESRMMQNTLDHSSNPQSVETFSRARASSNPERASRRPASRAQGRSKLAHVDNHDESADGAKVTPHRRRFLWLFSLKSSKKTQAETSGRATPQPKPSPSPSPPKPSSTHNQHGSSSKLHPDARSAGGSTLMQPDTSSGMPARTPPLSTSASSIRSSSVETTAEDDQVPVSAGKLNVPSSGSLSTSQASSLDKPPPRSSSAASLASMLRRGSNGLFSSGSENKKTHTESSEIQKYRDTSGSASADEKKKDKKPRKRDRLSIAFGGSKSKKPDFSHLPPSPKLSADMIDAWQQQPPQPSPSASDEHSSVESGKEAPAPPLHVSGPPPVSSAPPSEGIPPHPPVLPRTESAPSSHPVESYMPVDSFVQKRLPMPPYPSSESSTPDGKEATEVFTSAQASPPPTTIQQRDSIPLQLQPVVMSQQLHPFPQHQPEEVPTPTTATSSDSSGFGVAKDLPQPPAKSRSTSNHQSQGLPPRDASMTQPARQTKSSQASSVTSNLSATQYPWVNSSVRSQSPEPIVTA